jgi:hypothetical protein
MISNKTVGTSKFGSFWQDTEANKLTLLRITRVLGGLSRELYSRNEPALLERPAGIS